jgi:hypothetical protein
VAAWQAPVDAAVRALTWGTGRASDSTIDTIQPRLAWPGRVHPRPTRRPRSTPALRLMALRPSPQEPVRHFAGLNCPGDGAYGRWAVQRRSSVVAITGSRESRDRVIAWAVWAECGDDRPPASVRVIGALSVAASVTLAGWKFPTLRLRLLEVDRDPARSRWLSTGATRAP